VVVTLPDPALTAAPNPALGRAATFRYSWVLPFGVGAVAIAVAVAGIAWVGSAIGTALLILFLLFFVRHLAFAAASLSGTRSDLDAEAGLPAADPATLPTVSVLVACKDEETVVDDLLDALLALDYPRGRLEWVLVDDGSTDATGELLDRRAATVADLHVVHRSPGRRGGKSAALNDALLLATGDILIVFDADHRPHADTVRRLVRHFADPSVGAAQGRCIVANAGDSLLAQLVALDYAGGYLVNEYGRQAVFQLPAYGGANCAVRADLLRSLGGWNEASVTEDTDLTLRVLLSGHRVRYDVTAVDEEEGVVSLRRFWRQRYRWARGHQQCWRDYRSAVWRSPRLTFLEKVETTMFLFGFHLPAVAALGIGVMVLWGLGIAAPAAASQLFVFTMLLFLGPLVELGGGLLLARADRRQASQLIWFLPMFFAGMALCTKAWVDGVLDRPYAWAKTKRRRDGARPVPTIGVAAAAGGLR
jgi:cellulose synthase/poly-beta-1,6-N-acetylglucosamine synthase-like glycosyltransferase